MEHGFHGLANALRAEAPVTTPLTRRTVEHVCTPHTHAQVIDRFGADLTPASLEAMPFADAVVREVLRVAPPSAAVFRKTTAHMEVTHVVG
jgi:hypothetical protein